MTTGTPSLTVAELETVYDLLAQSIDRAGQEKTSLFLVKLALLNANALADVSRFRDHLESALRDL
jgi:hypothetical protein